MSKKSRGFQAGGQPPSGSSKPGSSGSDPSDPTPARPAASSAPTSRSAARRSSRATPAKPPQTGLAKYRTILIVGAVILGIGVLALAFYSSATATRYECESLLTAPPQPSEDDGGSPLPGFATRDMGRSHVPPNSTVRFDFCPPASGNHWTISGRAPVQRQFYRIGDDVTPGNWVHNLEHGFVIIAYRDALAEEQEDGIREVFETATQVPSAAGCNIPNKVLVVPFADMSEPFALLAWDRVLLLPEWDTEQALDFANRWQENPQSPESTSC